VTWTLKERAAQPWVRVTQLRGRPQFVFR